MGTSKLVWTEHALARANERFPGIDLAAKYERARVVRKGKTKSRIRNNCPLNAKKWMEKGFIGRYFLKTQDNIIFVMQAPETVVTVFRLEDKPI